MKNNAIIGFVGLLVVGAVFVYVSQSDSAPAQQLQPTSVENLDDAAPSNEELVVQQPEVEGEQNAQNPQGAQYIPYSAETFAPVSTARTVLFFYANWCPTCKAAEADLQQKLSDLPSDVRIIRVNYNDTQTDQEEKNLAQRYAITYQHTFVLIADDGTEITKWVGGQTAELLQNLQ